MYTHLFIFIEYITIKNGKVSVRPEEAFSSGSEQWMERWHADPDVGKLGAEAWMSCTGEPPKQLCEASMKYVGVASARAASCGVSEDASTPFSQMNNSTAARLQKRLLPASSEACALMERIVSNWRPGGVGACQTESKLSTTTRW